MTLHEKISALLRFVPVPLFGEAADAVFGVIEVVHGAHVDAAKNQTTPPDLEAWRKAVADAAADAGEPWKRIRDRAKGETRDPRGNVTHGSPGD